MSKGQQNPQTVKAVVCQESREALGTSSLWHSFEFLDLSLVETSFVFHFKKILNLDKKRVLEAESCSMTNEEEDVFLLYFELTAT